MQTVTEIEEYNKNVGYDAEKKSQKNLFISPLKLKI